MTKEKKLWIARPYDPNAVDRLVKRTGVSPIVAQVLAGRKIVDPEKIVQFLAPPNLSKGLYPPEALPGCERAAKLLADAVRVGKRIIVYGDYDVDGMTATAILLQAIQTVGGTNVGYYVPNRLEEGYGLNCASLRRLREDENADVVVTVDCGVSSLKEAELAKELGVQLIITDHHTPLADPETG
ncbi:MAG: DHH family phosphoesterase, partial [Thermoguttaceae bacterium]|nr:DHH family phosphoesterase [Thermoguttaceae bacterium]